MIEPLSSHEERVTTAEAMSAQPSIVVISMPERGHVQRLLPLIAGLAVRGRTVHVMTDSRFAGEVERAGGRFFDLFARYPIAAADATSIPVPSRYVTFAGVYAEPLIEEVARLAPGLIVYDTYAVIAPVIARRLGIPYVNVCAGHAAHPARTVAALREDPRVATSAACWEAVRRLRSDHGMLDASPFSHVEAMSPFLNLYGEPPQFLPDEDRPSFEPLAFFGSLELDRPALSVSSPDRLFHGSASALRVYVSFGTVIWRYFEAIACAGLSVIATALAERDVEVVMSLGNHPLDPAAVARLERPNVRVERYVDQWSVLADADVFITHHGLNSTHEAIFHQVPMISYPFFGDQPAQALCCQALGLAVPLGGAPRAPIEPGAVYQAIERVAADRAGLAARLDEARSWELETIAGRSAIIDRILALRVG
jgi:MGT family glycosyltransferase